MDSHRIILVGGSRFLREMLKCILKKTPDLEVVAEVNRLAELPKVIERTAADRVICCLVPGNRISAVLEGSLESKFPEVRVLGIAMDGSRVKLARAGLKEKFLDDSTLDELTDLLRLKRLPGGAGR